jgi:hypothetical protein
MEFEFEFVVAGLTREQCQDLLVHIVAEVEEQGGEVGGGFHEFDANEVVANDEAIPMIPMIPMIPTKGGEDGEEA